MGLTTWKNGPRGPIRRADVVVARNYLSEPEITELNRVVSMYLDYAEDQAHRRHPMHMAKWVEKLDAFLQFNERNILTHAGAVSHELAEQYAHAQFDKHARKRLRDEASLPTSDFDKLVDKSKRMGKELPAPSQQKRPRGNRRSKPRRRRGNRR